IELDGEHAIFEVTVPNECIGMTVGQLDIRRKYKINIMGIKNNGKFTVSITPDTVLTEDKTLMVVGEYKALQKCFRI
ncbi:MAG: TrkA C-terminal domain-containing protein, partial [Clostridia bacterium]|nr:TrkA C-terminal domain-containing protein [Clostridia bacterium]